MYLSGHRLDFCPIYVLHTLASLHIIGAEKKRGLVPSFSRSINKLPPFLFHLIVTGTGCSLIMDNGLQASTTFYVFILCLFCIVGGNGAGEREERAEIDAKRRSFQPLAYAYPCTTRCARMDCIWSALFSLTVGYLW